MGLFDKREETATPTDRSVVDGTEVPPAPPPREGIRETAPPPTQRLDGDQPWKVEAVTTHVAAPGAYEVRPAMGSLSLRIGLTILGAAAMIVSAFLEWFVGDAGDAGVVGTDLTFRVFSPVGSLGDQTIGIIESAGLVAIGLGVLALLGLAFRMGWLTRLAGALGIIGFAMYAIRVYRDAAGGLFESIGLGAWLLLAGGIVALVGGFMGTARKVVVPEERDVVTGHKTTVVEPD